MDTAYFALNPLHGTWDRARKRADFDGPQKGINPLSPCGGQQEFHYGGIYRAERSALDPAREGVYVRDAKE